MANIEEVIELCLESDSARASRSGYWARACAQDPDRDAELSREEFLELLNV